MDQGQMELIQFLTTLAMNIGITVWKLVHNQIKAADVDLDALLAKPKKPPIAGESSTG